MKIVSFNINGLRARLHQLQAIIERLQPDIIGLQEIKVADEQFPEKEVRQLGYNVYYHGQKGHYGVALLSKRPALSINKGFPQDDSDAQRRFIYGEFLDQQNKPIIVMNGYFPQGENRNHPTKFPNKISFYQTLQQLLQQQFNPQQALVLMGDINISPQDIDIGIGEINRLRWLKTGKCSFLPEEREIWQTLLSWGFEDSFRKLYPNQADIYSWFDYRSKGFEDIPKRGLRIDVILTSLALSNRLEKAGIDYEIRAIEKPSDHAPVWLQIS